MSVVAHFLVGVNYWPRSSAMAMWSRFDLGEIDEDLARMAELGLEVVRFFLTWEVFQPEPERVDAASTQRFIALLDRIAAHKMRAIPTLFCGHMSGVNWLPAWTLDSTSGTQRFRTIASGRVVRNGIGDFYTGELLEAERFFVRELGARARDHSAILAWDLGNEFSNLRAPRSVEDAAHWCAALSHDLFTASNRGVTAGTHGEDITFERCIRPSSLCGPLKFATMHGYPAYSSFARGAGDPEVVPFLCSLTSSFSEKEVFFTEFGTPVCAAEGATALPGGMPCLDDESAGRYAAAVLPRLWRRGALGALWWCWTDYDPALAPTPPFDRAPHELRFGMLRADGTLRPVASVLTEFARARHSLCPAPPPFADETIYYAGLPESVQRTYDAYVAAWSREKEAE
jgi:endo-1,4-beta-mannosidase